MATLLWRKELAEEAKNQLWLAGPMIFVSVFQYSLEIVSLIFVGHLDELLLAGASLAISFVNVVGFNVVMGMTSALDTFCGQAYGAEKFHMVGVHTQGAMLIITLVTIPMSIIWLYLGPILVFFHQDKSIAEQAQLYARFLIPSLSANGLLLCITKFLQTQNIVFPMLLSAGVTSLVHILLCWVFVLKLELGIKGCAIATCISNWFNTILLALYIWFSPSCKTTWTGFSKESLHSIPQFVRLALPSTFMVCLELWTFEIMILFSGALPNAKLQTSVISICLDTFAILWIIPYGISAAGSTRISNALGAGSPTAAYLAVKVSVILAFMVGLLEFATLMSMRKVWGRAFTNVQEVVTYMTSVIPILASSSFIDSIQTGFQGVARGCGWQKLGAFINLGAYYLIGIPLSVVFAFVLHMKAQGLLLGIIIALCVQFVCFLVIILRANWENEANKAITRVVGNEIQAEAAEALPRDQNVNTT